MLIAGPSGCSNAATMATRFFGLPAGLLALIVVPAMASLPYSPTKALLSPTIHDLVYVFKPSTASSNSQLLALNASRTLSAGNLPFTTISKSLPFLADGQNQAYSPAIDDQGRILVYTGNCSEAESSSLWAFTPRNESSNPSGAWAETNLSLATTAGNTSQHGANYLASALAFSSSNNATSDLYVFGGMCPNLTSGSADNWTQSATYSNKMLTLESAASSLPSSTQYTLGISSSRGPPIAEAGFSMTALEPAFSQQSNGVQAQQKSQNFVLVGGHTQQAFINMSQIALFSLPEQSWTFLPVDPPTAAARTDLSARDTAIDSRSGHSAVLTPDGRQIIIFGGWVGDIQTLANPQLAILQLGAGYGGTGDWQWSVPLQSGPGPTKGVGLYGHSGVMLPGGVMMIVGGYTIPASGNPRARKRDLSQSTQTYFFNTTSGSWISSYTHPSVPQHLTSSNADPGSINPSGRAGLGAGLAFGFLAIIGIVIVYFWYSRRLKRRREAHEEELRNLAAGGQRALSQGGLYGRDGEMTMNAKWMEDRSRTSRDTYPWGGNPGAERTGLLFEVPSPTRGLRRSLHSRGAYQPAPYYDDGRQSRTSGNIHVIDERDEYEPFSAEAEMLPKGDGNILDTAPNLDPFRDASRTPSPESPARERALEVQNWVSDWAAADALMQQRAGRISPDKTDRTSSTLSEQSTKSALSAHSIGRSVGTISRSMSQRSAALFSTNPFSTATTTANNTAAPSAHLAVPGGQKKSPEYDSTHRRSQSLTIRPNPRRSNTSDTFMTAPTSFPQLQLEGEALLGGYKFQEESSPAKSQSRAKGWMGSMRRAFTGADRSTSTSPENRNNSASSSPTKYQYTEAGIPRRAASAGAMLWQKRQGAKDWDIEGRNHRTDSRTAGADDEEWDVESAVEKRVVQVMFTVPREKLRVVNAGPDGDGVSVLSSKGKEVADGDVVDGKGKEKEKEKE